jgi:flagellar hook-associated protein 1 FlgK
MAGLLSALNTASTALEAFSQALGVDQSNIANVSTPGYAAQRASILPVGLPSGRSADGDYVTLSSTGDPRTDAIVQAATSQASDSQTQASQLSPINQLFDITGSTGILAAFQQFSTAFANLSVSPNDPGLGAAALSAAGAVASAFQATTASLDTQSTQLASSIQSTTSQINALSADIRQLNVQTTSSLTPSPGIEASVRSDLDQLSSLVDITVTSAPNGAVSVLAGGELPLVIGDQSYSLSVDPSAAPGSQVSSSGGGSSPASFSGQLGALLQTQNGTVAQLLGSGNSPGTLNTLAAGFASRVNALLSSGTTTGGAPGVPIFTYDTVDPTNAARTLALDPSVTPDQLGLATTGAGAASNGVSNQLAALAGSTAAADQIGGLSAEALFGSIASSVGQQLSDANTASTADQTTLTMAQANRQQESGVSLDQEAVNITTEQRAYEANAQVVSILNQLTEDTINLIPVTTG